MPAEGNFGKVFRLTMAEVGMPWPDAIGDQFEKVTTVAGELLAALQVGKNVSVYHVLVRQLPKAVAAGEAAAGGTALVASAAGTLGAAYVGAVIGSLIVAAYDTWGPLSIGKLHRFVSDCERTLGKNFNTVMRELLTPSPGLSSATMTFALHRARLHSTPGRR